MLPLHTINSNFKYDIICFQKLARRKTGLDHVDWVESRKQKVREALTPDFMSSESEDEHGMAAKQLWWESEELRVTKADLDDVYVTKVATQRQRRMLRPVTHSADFSQRDIPCQAPAWTCA